MTYSVSSLFAYSFPLLQGKFLSSRRTGLAVSGLGPVVSQASDQCLAVGRGSINIY